MNQQCKPSQTTRRTSRRRFLQMTGATAVATTFGPTILGAEDKAGTKRPVIGVEGHRYEVWHDCVQLPSHIRWTIAQGVAVDREGLVYIKHRTKTSEPIVAIVVFDANGKYVRSFGKEFHSGGHGIDIR